MAYYVIAPFFSLFHGIIEGIIINLVGGTVAVLISSSEGKLGRAILGCGSVYIITTLAGLELLTLIKL
ncbi:hypothetical protein CM19_00840 [Candidatus Acidianus copahuensis]|uniref:Uncharacterized protein n=2 Tax=Candidatus Acidianus copahuensis TaxID=1160895 RepID=A0A031LT49_9CREN|nr:hypothetical protein CM19_00840 [Candidatus Acidianus copahuensis]